MSTSFLRQRMRTPRLQGRYLPQLMAFEDRLSLGDAVLGSVLGSALLGNAVAASFAESAPAATALSGQVLDNSANSSLLISSSQGAQERDAAPASSWLSSLDFAAPPADAPFTQAAQAVRQEADLLAFVVGTSSYAGNAGGMSPSALRHGGAQVIGTPGRGQSNGGSLDWFAGANTPVAASAPTPPPAHAPSDDEVRAKLAAEPIRFETNQGQTDSQVQFLARAPGYTLFVAPTEAVLLPKQPETEDGARLGAPPTPVSMQVVGGDAGVRGVGEDRQAHAVSYFLGDDPSQWVTGVSTYAVVSFTNVYEGIDLRYYSQDQQLEYDFIVAPGASPSTIELAFSGADAVALDAQGDLVLQTEAGELRQHRPFTYQEMDGARREVASAFVLGADGHVRFQVGAYDAAQPLVIDPVMFFSTYVGGAGMDVATGITTDLGGNPYVVGRTDSLPPTFMGGAAGSYGPLGGAGDVFLTVLPFFGGPGAVTIYIGGSGDDQALDIAVNPVGRLFIVGETNSCNFPVTNGTGGTIPGFDQTCNGGMDAFLTVLNPTWFLLSSTYFGGAGNDSAHGVAVFNFEWAVLTGSTTSVNLPILSAFQPAHSGGGTTDDGFVAEINPFFAAGALFFSTYFGAPGVNDGGRDVALDASLGDIYVTGFSGAGMIPSLIPQTCMTTGSTVGDDAIALKLRIHTGIPQWHAHVGGVFYDRGFGVAWDPSLQLVYVAGETASGRFGPFPLPVDPYAGGMDGFVARIWDGGLICAPLDYTFLGGPQDDGISSIALTPWLDAYVTGYTESPTFPTLNPAPVLPASYTTFGGGVRDAFATQLIWTLNRQYSYFLGGPAFDVGRAVAFGPWTTFYAGRTDSSPGGFPLQTPTRGVGALREGFVTHMCC